MLLVRFSISQMDVPTRQSYTMAIVAPSERSAAAGVTGIARSLGVAASPLIAAPLLVGSAVTGAPFVIGGALKIVYDLLLYRSFRTLRPPEERSEVDEGQDRADERERLTSPGISGTVEDSSGGQASLGHVDPGRVQATALHSAGRHLPRDRASHRYGD